jgi:hypothetical protein
MKDTFDKAPDRTEMSHVAGQYSPAVLQQFGSDFGGLN